MSVYRGELTVPKIIENVKKIKQSFPNLPAGFYDVFADRIKQNNFNDERMEAAVNYVIDNCVYPVPTIAQFISFDTKIKLYNYAQMTKIINELGGKAFNYYKSVRVSSKQKNPVYASIQDIEKYQLTLWAKAKK